MGSSEFKLLYQEGSFKLDQIGSSCFKLVQNFET